MPLAPSVVGLCLFIRCYKLYRLATIFYNIFLVLCFCMELCGIPFLCLSVRTKELVFKYPFCCFSQIMKFLIWFLSWFKGLLISKTISVPIYLETRCSKLLPANSLVIEGFPRWHSPNAGDSRSLGSISGSGRSLREGSGNPLQNSCLENPMDRGAWQATNHWVTKGWT